MRDYRERIRTMKSLSETSKRNAQQGLKEPAQSAGVRQTHYMGIHNRRDKRYPLRPNRLKPEDVLEAQAYEAARHEDDVPPEIPDWKEALVLWLSWNSTYEKLTKRMCKQGQSKDKIEAMMDELDELRGRALKLSEDLISRGV
jgi:hypothetical protein